jgi:hypothetical protein
VNADAKHNAAVHDSQELDGLLDKGNTCNDVFADSAYRSAEIEAKLKPGACSTCASSARARRARNSHFDAL